MNLLSAATLTSLLFTALFFGDCRSRSIMEAGADNTAAANSTPNQQDPEKRSDDFAERLKAVKTADFDFIFVFRRKDGSEMTTEDKQFLKTTAPAGTNRWDLTADKKTVIAGSNYMFTEEILQNLQSRFNVEDYSKQQAK